MKIEALTICAGYADFLAETLPRNAVHFDHVLVVTSFEDADTQQLCRELSIECRPTDLLNKGGPFAKGRAIDWGLGFLEKSDWVCHLDADIYLPPQTRRLIEGSEPDDACIYGCDRVNCVGNDAWDQYLAGENKYLHQFRHHCLLVPPPFPMMARLILPEHEGYVPIGFFQLWHASHGRRYPLHQTTAEHTDVLHALQWPRDKRRLMEEVIAVHLESSPGEMGRDWHGRKTPPFRPAAAPNADRPYSNA